VTELSSQVLAICHGASGLGYRGHLGVDFLLDGSGRLS